MMNLVTRAELQLIILVKTETAIGLSTVFVLVIGSAQLQRQGSMLFSYILSQIYFNVHDNHYD